MTAQTVRLIVIWIMVVLSVFTGMTIDGRGNRAFASIHGRAEPPIMPARFFGTVQVDGRSVAEGTELTAVIGSVKYATTTIRINGSISIYAISIPAARADGLGVREGATITFEVGGRIAEEDATWHSGAVTALNLTVMAGVSGTTSRVGEPRRQFAYTDIYQPRTMGPTEPVRPNVAPCCVCVCQRTIR